MLSKKELLNIYGGAISGTLLNAFSRIFTIFYEVGRSLGNSIREIREKNN